MEFLTRPFFKSYLAEFNTQVISAVVVVGLGILCRSGYLSWQNLLFSSTIPVIIFCFAYVGTFENYLRLRLLADSDDEIVESLVKEQSKWMTGIRFRDAGVFAYWRPLVVSMVLVPVLARLALRFFAADPFLPSVVFLGIFAILDKAKTFAFPRTRPLFIACSQTVLRKIKDIEQKRKNI